MTFKIGFTAESSLENTTEVAYAEQEYIQPRKSVVDIQFPNNGIVLSYYNDQFDLHCGDLVYVDGKFEGILGRVVKVNYNFKIKITDYKRVIAVADTTVHGEFFMAGSHFVTFQRNTLPISKAVTWFMSPVKDDEEIVSGCDETEFLLDNLSGMDISSAVAERGHGYYMNNRVRYICLDGVKGYAVVEGSKNYEVEFEYFNGKISKLTCSCFCSGNCKHEFATMLQLRELLAIIKDNYPEQYEDTGYFSAVGKGTLFEFAIDNKVAGAFVL